MLSTRPEQLLEQGTTPASSRTYVEYLKALPARRGQLLNLLFSNGTQPQNLLLTI
jgi:hypothetical protein